MRFTISAAAFLAMVSSALAQTANFDPITSPTKDQEIPAGSSFDIVWQPSTTYTGTVTLSLLGGSSPSTLVTVSTISSGVDNSAGKYTWMVDSALGKDSTYGIQITLDSDKTIFQYSFPFHIKGGSGGSSSSTSASGTVTYTLSSLTSTTEVSSSTGVYSTMYPTGNLSTIVTTARTTAVQPTSGGSGGSKTSSGTGSVPTSGATNLVAGSVALLGGLAVAALAL